MFEEVLDGNELKELKNRFSASPGQCETLEGSAWTKWIKIEQKDGLLHTQPGGNGKK